MHEEMIVPFEEEEVSEEKGTGRTSTINTLTSVVVVDSDGEDLWEALVFGTPDKTDLLSNMSAIATAQERVTGECACAIRAAAQIVGAWDTESPAVFVGGTFVGQVGFKVIDMISLGE